MEHKHLYAVRTMCRVLDLSTSGYYAWAQHPQGRREQENLKLMDEIREIHQSSHQTYGSPRIAKALQQNGLRCSRQRAARLMQRLGIRAKTARKFKVTTDSNHQEPIAPNLLEQNFTVEAPNKVWTSDITYVMTKRGWQYLTIILELFSREIIGYSLSNRLTAKSTVVAALDMAVKHRCPPEGVILKLDRGIQSASKSFRKRLKKYRMIQSMSGKGNCYDNAVIETVFKTLKIEWIYGTSYADEQALRLYVFEYIELFYNRKRLHSSLGYLPPAEFMRQYYQQPRAVAS
jgi:transposase InsO family protein